MLAFLWMIMYYSKLIQSSDKLTPGVLNKINEFAGETQFSRGLSLLRACNKYALLKTERFMGIREHFMTKCEDQQQKVLNNVALLLHKLKYGEIKEFNNVEIQSNDDIELDTIIKTGIWHYLALVYASAYKHLSFHLERASKMADIFRFYEGMNELVFANVETQILREMSSEIEFVNYIPMNFGYFSNSMPDYNELIIVKEILKHDIYNGQVSLAFRHYHFNERDFKELKLIDKHGLTIDMERNFKLKEAKHKIININPLRIYDVLIFRSMEPNIAFELQFGNIIIGNDEHRLQELCIEFKLMAVGFH